MHPAFQMRETSPRLTFQFHCADASRIKFNQVESTCPCPEGSFSKWETLTTTSYVVLSVGGATLLGGLSWWLASPSQGSPAYALTLRPDGIGIVGNF